jgi:hypothetical protein
MGRLLLLLTKILHSGAPSLTRTTKVTFVLLVAALAVLIEASRLDIENAGSPCYETYADGNDDFNQPQVKKHPK